MEHQLWFTAVLNKLLAGPVTALLNAIAQIHYSFTWGPAWLSDLNFSFAWVKPEDPAHPIPDYVAIEILVLFIILVIAVLLRRGLSVERPGPLQHILEVVYSFTRDTAGEIIGHGSERYVPMLGTLFMFVLICNLMGLIPTLGVPNSKLHIEVSPTGLIESTLGCAVAAFLYYNYHGIRHHGVFGYIKHLCGPILLLAVLMFPIEVVGNLGRMLSLSVRLYANMLVGGILERVFGGLIPLALPVVFMALHIFVSLLQAYIFMLLPAIYISMAVSEEH